MVWDNREERRIQNRRRGERGAVSLEMALLLPILLLLVLGLATLGHAMTVRFMLSSAAYDAARLCTLSGKQSQACAKAAMTKKLGKSINWCKPLNVTGKMYTEAGYTDVKSFEVNATCAYKGAVGTKFLASYKITLVTLRARAVMPY